MLQQLKQIVRGTDSFRAAEARDRLIQAPKVEAGIFVGSTADPTAMAQVCARNCVNSVGRRFGNQRLDVSSSEITKYWRASQDPCSGIDSRKNRSRASIRKSQ